MRRERQFLWHGSSDSVLKWLRLCYFSHNACPPRRNAFFFFVTHIVRTLVDPKQTSVFIKRARKWDWLVGGFAVIRTWGQHGGSCGQGLAGLTFPLELQEEHTRCFIGVLRCGWGEKRGEHGWKLSLVQHKKIDSHCYILWRNKFGKKCPFWEGQW